MTTERRDLPGTAETRGDRRSSTMTATKAAEPAEAAQPTEETTPAMARPGLGHQPLAEAALVTEVGTTRIADGVVAKIAGLAARDIPGVFSMGTGIARRMGQLKSLVPGGSETTLAGQGVSVQVGERETAIDLDLVTWYGQSIIDICDAVRRNVIGQVQGMTGLKVVEVNIQIDDIHVESETPEPTTRVQ